jgi:cell division protease FtsH
VVLSSITTGAENDLQQITLIARNMIARWGMSKRVGLLSFSDRPSPFGMSSDFGTRDYSEQTAAIIDEEARQLIDEAYVQVRKLLSDHRVTLERIAQELRRQETVDAKQLSQILIETGVSLAEAAPTPNAETTSRERSASGASALGPNGASGSGSPNVSPAPGMGGMGMPG